MSLRPPSEGRAQAPDDLGHPGEELRTGGSAEGVLHLCHDVFRNARLGERLEPVRLSEVEEAGLGRAAVQTPPDSGSLPERTAALLSRLTRRRDEPHS